MRTVISLIVFFLSVSLLRAQKVFTQEELDAVLHPSLVECAEEILRFNQTEINAGILSEDDKPQVFTFTCKNVGKQKLVVTEIKTTCGCTSASVSHPMIAPGEKAVIHMTYNPFGQPGRIYTRAFIYTNLSEEKPVAALTLVGRVTPSSALWRDYKYAMGSLRVRAKVINLGIVNSSMHRLEKIACANAGSKELKVSAVKGFLPDFLKLRTEPEVLEAGQEGFLVVEMDGKKLPEEKGKKQLNVLLEGLSIRPSERTIRIRLEIK